MEIKINLNVHFTEQTQGTLLVLAEALHNMLAKEPKKEKVQMAPMPEVETTAESAIEETVTYTKKDVDDAFKAFGKQNMSKAKDILTQMGFTKLSEVTEDRYAEIMERIANA